MPPPCTGTPLDSMLAGIAEKLADDAGLPRPRWTEAVPALAEPWVRPGTPRMVDAAHTHAPAQLLKRKIHLAEDDLWRARD
ncbi:MAG: hypothetical protein JJE52_13805 [Acidimicrobiia bacterium]|nr:hypothetical protein [Acidimicrobiia bacterium]